MSTYENAPATKLLATNCACCGRALVDAVSVETGIGPDCRANFGIAADATNRDEANALVFAVAKKGVDKAECRAICEQLRALGFEALAARILKRFRMTFAPAVDVEALRAEYAKVRADFCYGTVTPIEFNALVVAAGAKTPEEFVACAKEITCDCRRCSGTGHFFRHGAPAGDCFRCGGKGYQTREDAVRNRAYDEIAMNRAGRAA